MKKNYDLRDSWKSEHGGAPLKCILDVSKNIRYFLDLTMSENGLTSIQTRILVHLRKAQDENRDVFQRDIEEAFRIKRSSVTSVLQTLEKKELIVRQSIPEDARVKKLVLTQKAIKMQSSTYHIIGEMEQDVRSIFTEQEFEQFLDYMSRIDQKTSQLYQDKKKEEKKENA